MRTLNGPEAPSPSELASSFVRDVTLSSRRSFELGVALVVLALCFLHYHSTKRQLELWWQRRRGRRAVKSKDD